MAEENGHQFDVEEAMDYILTLIDENLSDEEIVAKVRERYPEGSDAPVSLIDLFRTKPKPEDPTTTS